MPPPPPPRRRYYGGRTTYVYSNGSSSGAFVTIIMLMLVLIVFSFYMQFKGGYTGDTLSDNRISEYAEDQYNTIFSGREDGLLLVVDENDNGQFKYGVKANALMDTYINSMISAYQNNYNDDLGIQLKGMLEDTLEIMKQDGISKIKSDKAFDSHCYRDDLYKEQRRNRRTGILRCNRYPVLCNVRKDSYHRQGNESFCRRIQGTDHRSSGCHRRMYPLLMVEEAYCTEEQGAGGLRAYIKDTA